jgi:hypothetical protein
VPDQSVIVWNLETVPDLGGFAAANDLVGKSEVESARPLAIGCATGHWSTGWPRRGFLCVLTSTGTPRMPSICVTSSRRSVRRGRPPFTKSAE